MEILHQLDSLPYKELEYLGINVLKQPIEVMPVTHYTLGGVRIDEWAQTSVPGLYAAGEISGNIHGANRTSGNALAETQVFGRRAGIRAAEYACDSQALAIDKATITLEIDRIYALRKTRPGGIRPIDFKRKVKAIMHQYVHYRRNAKGLSSAVNELNSLRNDQGKRVQAVAGPERYNYEWEEALETHAIVRLAEMTAAAALAREESRGHHWRTDFPEMRSEWAKHTIVKRTDEARYQVTDAPVVRLKDRTKERRRADPALVEAGVLEGYEAL